MYLQRAKRAGVTPELKALPLACTPRQVQARSAGLRRCRSGGAGFCYSRFTRCKRHIRECPWASRCLLERDPGAVLRRL